MTCEMNSFFKIYNKMLVNLVKSIPPITRIQLLVFAIVGGLVYNGILSRYDLYFNLEKIVFSGQIWRLITSLTYVKQMNLYFLFQLYFFCQISSSIEKSAFKRGSIDYLYFLVSSCFVIYLIASFYGINYLSNIYIYSLYYYYGRINSNHLIIVNFMPIRAPFLIWFMLLFDWLLGNPDLKNCILSIVIGHTFYFIYNVYHKLKFVQNKQLFDTPRFFVQLVGPLFDQQNAQQQQNDQLFL